MAAGFLGPLGIPPDQEDVRVYDRCWFEGRNPYSLLKPASWWLKRLFDYDAELVVMPSVKEPGYRLCRRTQHRPGLGKLAAIHGHPDTIQMAAHGLLPVTTLTPWAVRNDPDNVIRDLRARDTWRMGAAPGKADAVVDRIESHEAVADVKKDAAYMDKLDVLTGEAFRSLQFRNGSAVAVNDLDRGRH